MILFYIEYIIIIALRGVAQVVERYFREVEAAILFYAQPRAEEKAAKRRTGRAEEKSRKTAHGVRSG